MKGEKMRDEKGYFYSILKRDLDYLIGYLTDDDFDADDKQFFYDRAVAILGKLKEL